MQLFTRITISFALFAMAISMNDTRPSCIPKPEHKIHLNECCPGKPRFMTRELADECQLPAGIVESGGIPPVPPNESHNNKSRPSCNTVMCVLAKQDLLDGTTMNRTAFFELMTNQYSSEWQKVIQDSMEFCSDAVDSKSECEPKRFIECFKFSIIKSCPDSVWLTSDECVDLRNFMKNCRLSKPENT